MSRECWHGVFGQVIANNAFQGPHNMLQGRRNSTVIALKEKVRADHVKILAPRLFPDRHFPNRRFPDLTLIQTIA